MRTTHISRSLLFFTLLSGFCQANQTDEGSQAQIKREVLTSFNSLVEAATDLDTERYFSFIDAEKFVGLNADGSNWASAHELRETVEPGFSQLRSVDKLHFPSVTISVIDAHTAILVNEFEQQATTLNGDNISFAGGGTQVWSKADGSWKIVSISASTKPPAQ